MIVALEGNDGSPYGAWVVGIGSGSRTYEHFTSVHGEMES